MKLVSGSNPEHVCGLCLGAGRGVHAGGACVGFAAPTGPLPPSEDHDWLTQAFGPSVSHPCGFTVAVPFALWSHWC